jgi:uncharacterized membrane protein (DUF373 family)
MVSNEPIRLPNFKGMKIETTVLLLMNRINRSLHLVLGIALVIGSLMVLVLFISDVYFAFTHRTLAEGFLHALGSLLILWTFSELLNSEIRYLKGGRLEVAVFIEVAIAATIRHVLISGAEAPDFQANLLTLGRLLILGAVYWLVAISQTRGETQQVQP